MLHLLYKSPTGLRFLRLSVVGSIYFNGASIQPTPYLSLS
nr:MAG TPA: hypothetical protein [Caudoviricetes sp.]DAP25170.1 MAG TPA: hypothetical protein [Caudoviricetes sp.]